MTREVLPRPCHGCCVPSATATVDQMHTSFSTLRLITRAVNSVSFQPLAETGRLTPEAWWLSHHVLLRSRAHRPEKSSYKPREAIVAEARCSLCRLPLNTDGEEPTEVGGGDPVGYGSRVVDAEVQGALAPWSQKEGTVGGMRSNFKMGPLKEREQGYSRCMGSQGGRFQCGLTNRCLCRGCRWVAPKLRTSNRCALLGPQGV